MRRQHLPSLAGDNEPQPSIVREGLSALRNSSRLQAKDVSLIAVCLTAVLLSSTFHEEHALRASWSIPRPAHDGEWHAVPPLLLDADYDGWPELVTAARSTLSLYHLPRATAGPSRSGPGRATLLKREYLWVLHTGGRSGHAAAITPRHPHGRS